jgi:hypothetical protein
VNSIEVESYVDTQAPEGSNLQAYILQERSDTNWPHCHVIFRRDNAMRFGPWDPIKWPMAPGQVCDMQLHMDSWSRTGSVTEVPSTIADEAVQQFTSPASFAALGMKQ